MSSNTAGPSGAHPYDLGRRALMRYSMAGAGAAGLASFVASTNEALAADGSVPADKSSAGYTLTAAYAASPPAVDEVAFTMEVENMLALTYSGDLMPIKPVPTGTEGVYAADMAASGNTGVIGHWVDKWEGSRTSRPGRAGCARDQELGRERNDLRRYRLDLAAWVRDESGALVFCQRNVSRQAGRYRGNGSVQFFRFNLSKPSPVVLKLMAMSYFGGPFDATLAKQHATASDPWAKEWLKNNKRCGLRPVPHREKHSPVRKSS